MPTGLVIGIVIFPGESSGVKTASGKDPYVRLAEQLNGLGPFRAWIADTKCKFTSCALKDARIYIYGKETRASGTDTPASLAFTSFFASAPTVERIGNVPLAVTSTSGKNVVPDLTSDQIRSLVGHLVIDDQFKVAINLPESDATLQLVPAPVNAADPDYEPILEHILGTFGVPATRSRLSASAIHGPSDAATCPGAQRYFVYRVRLEENARKLIGKTRLAAYAEGYVLDCTMHSALVPAATGKGAHDIPTTSTLLTDLSALAIALIPKASSRNLTLSTNAFSKLVDVDPRATDVRDLVASASLTQLVNNLCIRLVELQPSASPSPTTRTAAAGAPATSTVAPTAAPGPTGSPGPTASPMVLSRASPEPLQCKERIPYAADAPRGAAPDTVRFEDLRREWLGLPSPTPRPKH